MFFDADLDAVVALRERAPGQVDVPPVLDLVRGKVTVTIPEVEPSGRMVAIDRELLRSFLERAVILPSDHQAIAARGLLLRQAGGER